MYLQKDLRRVFGVKPLFENISFHIEEGDKIALVARNGAAKVPCCEYLPEKKQSDEGKLWVNKDVTVALV